MVEHREDEDLQDKGGLDLLREPLQIYVVPSLQRKLAEEVA